MRLVIKKYLHTVWKIFLAKKVQHSLKFPKRAVGYKLLLADWRHAIITSFRQDDSACNGILFASNFLESKAYARAAVREQMPC